MSNWDSVDSSIGRKVADWLTSKKARGELFVEGISLSLRKKSIKKGCPQKSAVYYAVEQGASSSMIAR
jgi:hypothetical protein